MFYAKVIYQIAGLMPDPDTAILRALLCLVVYTIDVIFEGLFSEKFWFVRLLIFAQLFLLTQCAHFCRHLVLFFHVAVQIFLIVKAFSAFRAENISRGILVDSFHVIDHGELSFEAFSAVRTLIQLQVLAIMLFFQVFLHVK